MYPPKTIEYKGGLIWTVEYQGGSPEVFYQAKFGEHKQRAKTVSLAKAAITRRLKSK